MSATYTKTFTGALPSTSTFTVTTGRRSVTTTASNTRIPGSNTQKQRALSPARTAERLGRELEADGWTLQAGDAS
jgi:hypothetical protein